MLDKGSEINHIDNYGKNVIDWYLKERKIINQNIIMLFLNHGFNLKLLE